VIYAAEAGSKALDGLFTPILAVALQQKGRTIDQVMKSVRSEVYVKSNGQQTPGEYNQLFEELFLGDLAENGQTPRAVSEVMPVVVPGNDPLADLRNLVHQGDAEAQYELGRRYYDGEGVAKDTLEAVKWFRKAADQGHAFAQTGLGRCYGEGVAKDQVEAVKWYRMAAEQGLAQAKVNLGVYYRDGVGVAKDEVEAARWFSKAADQGDALGQYFLGVCYEFGSGVPKNLVEAYAFYNLASLKKEFSKKNRDLLAEHMNREQVAAGQKRTKELQRELESN
jgi:TPR repeat protein